MSTIEPWDPERHRPLLAEWAALRGQGEPVWAAYPPTGAVVDGIVVGFLYRTDSTTAYLDSLTSDPRASAIRRGRAIHTLLRYLVGEAERHGSTVQVFSTGLAGVQGLASRSGFRCIGAGQLAFIRRSPHA